MRQYLCNRSPALWQWFAAGIIVLALHALVWHGLRSPRLASTPKVISRIEVELIAPPQLAQPVAPRVEIPLVQPKLAQILKSAPAVLPPPQPDPAPPTPFQAPSPDKLASQKAASPAETEPLTAPRFNAAYLHNPTPVYPAAARRTGYEGTVVIRARIQIDGSADRVEIKKSSGHGVLDQAALEAVRKWRFIPARRGNEAVVEWVEIPWQFKLEE